MQTERQYILNRKTSKIELHFSKQEYLALTPEQKAELKRNYLFSKYNNAWVSRSKNNHYFAIQLAEKLGFTNGGRIGERLSYKKELQQKAERAENKVERYEEYADNATKRAENLRSEFNRLRGDWAFVTQPDIVGKEAFTNRRNRIMARYDKGFEEYRKSEYFQQKAETAQKTADMKQLKNPVYLDNRIKECNKNIRTLEKNIIIAEEKIDQPEYKEWLDKALDKMEYEIDKLAFFENCMNEIKSILKDHGMQLYNREDIKPGYEVKIRGIWSKVLKANKTTVYIQIIEGGAKGFELTYPYVEIQDIRIPEGWKEGENKIENPFNIGDIVYRNNIMGTSMIRAYQVMKKTNKQITIQQIKIEDNKPVKDCFINDKQERKSIKKDKNENIVVSDGDWYLYKYSI